VRDQVVTDDLDTADLLALGVDLVVVGDDPGDIAARDLAEAGIPFFDGARPTDRDGVERQILDLATALGRPGAGEDLVERMAAEAEAILASVPATNGLTYFHEYDPGYATYAAGTLVDSLYAELGLEPIVPADADEDIIFFSADLLLAADPDVIVLGDIDCCAATAERAAARPGWSDLSAVGNGAVVEVPDDIANRWGANIVELLRFAAGGVAAAAGG
jgi:iron complex transport system substrate-binding protein